MGEHTKRPHLQPMSQINRFPASRLQFVNQSLDYYIDLGLKMDHRAH